MRQCIFIGLGLFLGLYLNTWKGEAVGMPIQIERMNPPGTTQPTAYTQLVRAGKILYFAGQTAVNEKGELIGKGDMRAQVRQVYENLKSLLASQGATFDHLVKITIYTLSIDEFRKAGDIREEYTGGRAPASTLLQIDRLASPDYLVEIEGIAVLE
jgi:enamine deaminase RidA (YjgF/YER057c/UK114 family)